MKNKIFLIIFVLFLANFFCWKEIFFYDKLSGVYFLNVDQGDSELIKLPKEVSILIDSGSKNNLVKKEISKIGGSTKKFDGIEILANILNAVDGNTERSEQGSDRIGVPFDGR